MERIFILTIYKPSIHISEEMYFLLIFWKHITHLKDPVGQIKSQICDIQKFFQHYLSYSVLITVEPVFIYKYRERSNVVRMEWLIGWENHTSINWYKEKKGQKADNMIMYCPFQTSVKWWCFKMLKCTRWWWNVG